MVATDIGKDSLSLQWDAPDNDGGCPVEKYIVERSDKSGRRWSKIATVPSSEGKSTFAFVDDTVVEGNEYCYRVRAVNKAGPGDPSDHGKAFKITAKPGGLHQRK